MGKLLDRLALAVQLVHDRDELSLKKARRFAKRRFWAYRAVAASRLRGEELDALIESEKNIAVIRQLCWSDEISSEQLRRIYKLHVEGKFNLSHASAVGELAYGLYFNPRTPEDIYYALDLQYQPGGSIK